MTEAMVFLAVMAVIVTIGIRLGRRAAKANAQINGDIAYLRAIPGDQEAVES